MAQSVMLKVTMQKEDLVKRLRLFAVLTTTLLVFLVVTLLIQFGFIANNRKKIQDMHNDNAALQQEIDDIEHQANYQGSDEQKKDQPQG